MDPLFDRSGRVLICLSGGGFSQVAFQGSGQRFKKEVLPEGQYTHPNTGRVHTFDRTTLEHIARQTGTYLGAGNQVPFPDGHVFESKSNMGFWNGFSVEPSTTSPGKLGLFALVDVPIASDAEKMGKTIKSVSVLLEREVQMSNGEKLAGPVCTHVCATNYPVVPGQSDFVAFGATSNSTGVDFFLSTGDQSMDLKKILAVALGLKADATDEQIATGVKDALARNQTLAADNSKLLEDVNKALAGTRPAQKSEREISLERELLAVRGQEASALLDSAQKEGRLSKAQADIFSLLLSVGQVSAIPFGKSELETIDVSKQVKTLLSILPAKNAFDPDTKSTRGTGDELAKSKATLAAKAAWFESRGYNLNWNADKTEFTVDRNKKG